MLQKGESWPVLDHGYVKFIGSMGDDTEIVEAARMSTGRGFVGWKPYRRCELCDYVDGPKLPECPARPGGHRWKDFPRGDMGFLEYMYSNQHMTPFEMCSLAIEVKAPIFVFREWHRHRTQKFNEFSARYAQMPNEHYLPALERIVKQSKTNKQASSSDPIDAAVAGHMLDALEREQESLYENYDYLIREGVANEIARINTPVSRYSKMRAKTDLRNWLGFLLLRKQSNHSKPQWEISQYANVVGDIIQKLWPRTYELFEEHTLYAETFSRSEMKIIRNILNGIPVRMTEEANDLDIDHRWVKSLIQKLGVAG
jgi:thymidylate synthase (FAD)